MNIIQIVIQTIGGLAVFLYGMRTMSDGLQQVAGERVRKVLGALSTNRFTGIISGTVITGLIQSSSATTVMLVGFVNAGLMNLHQAIAVILGANIGTTVTAQLMAFKITDAALPAVAVGVGLRFFARRRRTRHIGDIVLGFGLLFFGLLLMKDGMAPLKSHPGFVAFMTRFSAESLSGILLCVLTGTGLTMMVQASSATVGMTMVLASQGLIDFPGAAALVLGDNIGTTITAELAAIGAGVNAHRAARAHTMFNVIGVVIMVTFFPYYIGLVKSVTAFLGTGPLDQIVDGQWTNIGRYIANGHTMFNVINAMIFLAALTWLIRVATWLTPHREEPLEDLYQPLRLDPRHVDQPDLSLPQVRAEVMRMTEAAMNSLKDVVGSLESRSLKQLNKWRRREDALDEMHRGILAYLNSVYQARVDEGEAREMSHLIRMSTNVEHIGDSVENLALLIEDLIEEDLYFTPIAMRHVGDISGRVLEFMDLVIKGMMIETPDLVNKADKMEKEIDIMREEMRQGYINRLRSGACAVDPSLIFIDMLSAFEKMGDYCYNSPRPSLE